MLTSLLFFIKKCNPSWFDLFPDPSFELFSRAMIFRRRKSLPILCTVCSRKCAQVSLEGLMYIWLDFLLRMEILNGFVCSISKLKLRFPLTWNTRRNNPSLIEYISGLHSSALFLNALSKLHFFLVEDIFLFWFFWTTRFCFQL